MEVRYAGREFPVNNVESPREVRRLSTPGQDFRRE